MGRTKKNYKKFVCVCEHRQLTHTKPLATTIYIYICIYQSGVPIEQSLPVKSRDDKKMMTQVKVEKPPLYAKNSQPAGMDHQLVANTDLFPWRGRPPAYIVQLIVCFPSPPRPQCTHAWSHASIVYTRGRRYSCNRNFRCHPERTPDVQQYSAANSIDHLRKEISE